MDQRACARVCVAGRARVHTCASRALRDGFGFWGPWLVLDDLTLVQEVV
jgi:hypothetical protein